MHDFTPYPNGEWGCSYADDSYTPIGCKDMTIYTRDECESYVGYWWEEAATNKQGLFLYFFIIFIIILTFYYDFVHD